MDNLIRSGKEGRHNEQATLDPISAKFYESIKQNTGWWSLTINEETGLNVVTFSSGWGDGGYPSFWGFDENGEVVCLVTDFYMLDEAEPVEQES